MQKQYKTRHARSITDGTTIPLSSSADLPAQLLSVALQKGKRDTQCNPASGQVAAGYRPSSLTWVGRRHRAADVPTVWWSSLRKTGPFRPAAQWTLWRGTAPPVRVYHQCAALSLLVTYPVRLRPHYLHYQITDTQVAGISNTITRPCSLAAASRNFSIGRSRCSWLAVFDSAVSSVLPMVLQTCRHFHGLRQHISCGRYVQGLVIMSNLFLIFIVILS
ncbi:hypothetical protein T10_4676 [Trichinella papuae]|uniref:Uncharacterized protein n=1 Tax=Trichinella papuae TaxID=268474 RepID=A0A0V1MH59_9BILA|nr:hypothetical protein T10_4676 [Trichinella papuae]